MTGKQDKLAALDGGRSSTPLWLLPASSSSMALLPVAVACVPGLHASRSLAGLSPLSPIQLDKSSPI